MLYVRNRINFPPRLRLRRPKLYEVVLINPDREMENDISGVLQSVFRMEATESYIIWICSALGGEAAVFKSTYEIAETLMEAGNKELENPPSCFRPNPDIKFKIEPV